MMSSTVQHWVPQADMGTPAVDSTQSVSLTIDSQVVNAPVGTSVMRAALDAGIHVPKLCATDTLDSFGSCRVCLVEIEGRRGLPASCTTPVEADMVVHTQTEKVARVRRNVMELYISDHPLDCLTCAVNGDCELQDVAGQVGLREVRYGIEGANHLDLLSDTSNPYFDFNPAKCIQCSRCVRACEDTQGTFALTIDGRGFESQIVAGADVPFFESDCVSCGACVAACPTASLVESEVARQGLPTRVVETTCAYCGVGCSLRAELKGDEVVRMVPAKNGGANEGHACVKGRFAWGYATHKDRVLHPMIRESIQQEWREVSWDEAIEFAAHKLKGLRDEFGPGAIGGISSSRCTNEEVFVVQKMVRTAFGSNNIDTCARVCHSPTGYGLKRTFGASAGTQDFASVEHADVILLIGANPTDAHPVFASRLKRRLRNGAKLIVVDPRRIDLVRSPHVEASHHLQVVPGANVALINAIAHVVVTQEMCDRPFIEDRCDQDSFKQWCEFIADTKHAPEQVESITGVDAEQLRTAAKLYASAGNAAIYYGLGVTEHSQGSTMVMGLANLAMASGNIGRDGVGVNPLRGQNNVQGACDMGSFPHELPGYRHISDQSVRAQFEADWGVELEPQPGLRIPNMFAAANNGSFRGLFIQGEDVAQSDPDTQHVRRALTALDCLIVQDLFLNETSKFAHVFLPGTSFLEKDGTFTNAERRINRVRPVTNPLTGMAEWEVACRLATAMGYPMSYSNAAEIMDEVARLTPTFSGVSFDMLDRVGSVQWPCTDEQPAGTRIMHKDQFVLGKGKFAITEFVPTDERTTRRFPLILTTGRILSQYNVGAQTRRTPNSLWHEQDKLEIHESDAELRGIASGDRVLVSSRKGATALVADISERVPPGVVHTTFHHPESEANVVTTEFSDWATNCPEYKVTAVQVIPTNELDAS
jgi:formate dehydrogenase major subunit